MRRFAVYPNPTDGNFQVYYSASKPSAAKVVLMNSLGEVVYSEVKTFDAGDNVFLINSADIPSGLYTLQINIDGETMNRKVIVEK